jgi:hypothetical protein
VQVPAIAMASGANRMTGEATDKRSCGRQDTQVNYLVGTKGSSQTERTGLAATVLMVAAYLPPELLKDQPSR